MNDQLNNNTKPNNIKELFKMFLEITSKLYDTVTPKSVSKRKNKDKAKMSDIVDSFPLTTSKFGRAFFSKLFKGLALYGYCASKKEKYFGFKVHVVTDLDGNPYDYVLTAANVDDRDAVFDLSELVDIDILFGDKGCVGKFIEELRKEKGIKLYALKRSNSKNPLPKEFRNTISHLRRRIESTFNQLNEHFDIEQVRSKSMLGLQTSLEIKFLCFNLVAYLNGGCTHISDILSFN